MFYKTKEDEGLLEFPMIAPHLEVITFDNSEFGVSDDWPRAELNKINLSFCVDAQGNGHGLEGPLVRDVIRLANGSRNREEITEILKKSDYDEVEIKSTLVNLAYRFVLVSSDHSLSPGQAALFSAMGVTPRRAEACLAELKVFIRDLGEHAEGAHVIGEALRSLGCNDDVIVAKEDDANITIVLVDDYLLPELTALNESFFKARKQWIPLKLSGIEGISGPLFNLMENGPCFQCLRNNLHNSRELRGFLGRNRAGADVAKDRLFEASIARGRAGDALVQLVRTRLAADRLAPVSTEQHFQNIGQYVLSGSIIANTQSWHYVNKRPQCACCGAPQFRDNGRSPEPVDLFQGADEPLFTSGGMKARSPLQTWNRYKHLISPLTGVVTGVKRVSPPDDSWIHVYWAGSNLAIINKHFRALTNSLRTKSAGKGRSPMQAQVSALCEALERYSGVYDGTEIHRRARFVDFVEGEAMHPNDIMLFSETQYKMRDEIGEKAHRFYRLPEMDFDEHAEAEWTPFWSVTRERFVWILSIQAYFSYSSEQAVLNKYMANPDSNGAASGNTIAEAFVQGFMELVERDAYAIWWYNRLSYPEVDIGSFNDPFIEQLIHHYRTVHNRSLWVLDITHDFGIPVFVAVSERLDKQKRDICVSAGAHFDPHIALLRAVCELNQYASAVLDATDDPASYSYFDPECLDWWQTATTQNDPYLLPDKKARKTVQADYPLVERSQVEEVRACIDAVHAKGMDVLVMDQTRPDIDFPVIKVLVPGMRHFWARFAPGRLYDVPVAMGKLKEPTPEKDLNPIPVFI